MTSMARRAVYDRLPVFETFDIFQEIIVDGVHHLPHIASDLLGWLNFFFPFARSMTVGAAYSERPGQTNLHDSQ